MSLGNLKLSAADLDRIEGYNDGLDGGSPEPSGNRSASYRHGFKIGRADREQRSAFPTVAAALAASDEAEREDGRA